MVLLERGWMKFARHHQGTAAKNEAVNLVTFPYWTLSSHIHPRHTTQQNADCRLGSRHREVSRGGRNRQCKRCRNGARSGRRVGGAASMRADRNARPHLIEPRQHERADREAPARRNGRAATPLCAWGVGELCSPRTIAGGSGNPLRVPGNDDSKGVPAAGARLTAGLCLTDPKTEV